MSEIPWMFIGQKLMLSLVPCASGAGLRIQNGFEPLEQVDKFGTVHKSQ